MHDDDDIKRQLQRELKMTMGQHLTSRLGSKGVGRKGHY